MRDLSITFQSPDGAKLTAFLMASCTDRRGKAVLAHTVYTPGRALTQATHRLPLRMLKKSRALCFGPWWWQYLVLRAKITAKLIWPHL